jgi:hypothetical protein
VGKGSGARGGGLSMWAMGESVWAGLRSGCRMQHACSRTVWRKEKREANVQVRV